ncbi:hypothetical protein [Spirochaeta dissipatitropha]
MIESWGLRPLKKNESIYWQNSYVRVWVRRTEHAWRIAHSKQTEETEPEQNISALRMLLGKAIGFVHPQGAKVEHSSNTVPSSKDFENVESGKPSGIQTDQRAGEEPLWQDFIPDHPGDSIGILPILPETSVVVRTEVPISLGAGRSITMYGAIPLWLSIRVVDSEDKHNKKRESSPGRDGYSNVGTPLLTIPELTLSKTWFGGPMTGRLCYRSDKTMSYTPELEIDPLAYAVCPIHIRNSMRTSMVIGSIAVPTEQLRMYRTRGADHELNFWTNTVIATYSGSEELNLTVMDRKPKVEHELDEWMPARVTATDHLLQRGMILLRQISNS